MIVIVSSYDLCPVRSVLIRSGTVAQRQQLNFIYISVLIFFKPNSVSVRSENNCTDLIWPKKILPLESHIYHFARNTYSK